MSSHDIHTHVSKIEKLEKIWKSGLYRNNISDWLSQFVITGKDYRADFALLLSKFIYFNVNQVRLLLQHLYYEGVLYPLICEEIVKNSAITVDEINQLEEKYLKSFCFVPIGNPSESGALTSYFFRQANNISKDKFKYIYQIETDERHYFLDDVCLTGNQFLEYAAKLDLTKCNSYLTLIATEKAIDKIKTNTKLNVYAACILDDSYQLFSDESRYFTDSDEKIRVRDACQSTSRHYLNMDGLGYEGSQLALGFFYNTPDNTIELFHQERSNFTPIFKRYAKVSHD